MRVLFLLTQIRNNFLANKEGIMKGLLIEKVNQLDVSHFNAGMYFLRVNSREKVIIFSEGLNYDTRRIQKIDLDKRKRGYTGGYGVC